MIKGQYPMRYANILGDSRLSSLAVGEKMVLSDTASQNSASIAVNSLGSELSVVSGDIFLTPQKNRYIVAGGDVIVSQTPATAYSAASKSYVDSRISGLTWLDPVLKFWDPTTGIPVDPSQNDRYVASATANGWIIDNIYTFTGAIWSNLAPTIGDALTVLGGDLFANQCVIYGSTGWDSLGVVTDHNKLLNRGTYPHSSIDEHVGATSSCPHSGQDLRTSASPSFSAISVNQAPTNGKHAANKDYVDAAVASVDPGQTPTFNTIALHTNSTASSILGQFSSPICDFLIETNPDSSVRLGGTHSALKLDTPNVLVQDSAGVYPSDGNALMSKTLVNKLVGDGLSAKTPAYNQIALSSIASSADHAVRYSQMTDTSLTPNFARLCAGGAQITPDAVVPLTLISQQGSAAPYQAIKMYNSMFGHWNTIGTNVDGDISFFNGQHTGTDPIMRVVSPMRFYVEKAVYNAIQLEGGIVAGLTCRSSNPPTNSLDCLRLADVTKVSLGSLYWNDGNGDLRPQALYVIKTGSRVTLGSNGGGGGSASTSATGTHRWGASESFLLDAAYRPPSQVYLQCRMGPSMPVTISIHSNGQILMLSDSWGSIPSGTSMMYWPWAITYIL